MIYFLLLNTNTLFFAIIAEENKNTIPSCTPMESLITLKYDNN
jgi:hypothetical protein